VTMLVSSFFVIRSALKSATPTVHETAVVLRREGRPVGEVRHV